MAAALYNILHGILRHDKQGFLSRTTKSIRDGQTPHHVTRTNMSISIRAKNNHNDLLYI
jgi:hypothetical protein